MQLHGDTGARRQDKEEGGRGARGEWWAPTWFWVATKKKGWRGWKATHTTRPRFLRKGFWLAPLDSWCTSTDCRGGQGGWVVACLLEKGAVTEVARARAQGGGGLERQGQPMSQAVATSLSG